MIKEQGVYISSNEEKIALGWQKEGETILYLVVEQKVEGIIGVSDKIKPTSKKAIQLLQKNGIEIHNAYRR
ncbi:MAG: hypothetical protein HC906_01905 [Bacteroidales bacterium]|nr:hypothetical protein [Bacteroidales bacterium]